MFPNGVGCIPGQYYQKDVMKFKNKDKDGLFRSIFTAYFILLLHVFLLAGTGVTIIFSKEFTTIFPG